MNRKIVSDELETLVDDLKTGLEESRKCRVAGVKLERHHRRQSSTIIKCLVDYSDGASCHVWGKTLHPGGLPGQAAARTQRDFDLHTVLCEAFARYESFNVPRPVFCSPESRLIVTEHAPGDRLQDRLASGARILPSSGNTDDLLRSCHLAGEWLRAFQKATKDYWPGKSEGLPPPPLRNLERIARQALELLSEDLKTSTLGLGAALREQSVQLLQRSLDESPEPDWTACAIHGDFFPGNILVEPNRVTCIDFTSSTWGDPGVDVGYFIHQLQTLAVNPFVKTSTTELMIREFLSGYGHSETTADAYWRSSTLARTQRIALCLARLYALRGKRPKTTFATAKRSYHLLVTNRTLSDHVLTVATQ